MNFLQQSMGAQAGAAPADPRETGGQETSVELVAKMQSEIAAKVPDNVRSEFDRTIVAGQRVMYSDKMRDQAIAAAGSQKPVDQRLAGNAAGLILLLHRESGGSMPADVVMMAGAWLLLEMADLLLKAGKPLAAQDLRDAIDEFIALIMMKAGARQEQVMGVFGGAEQQQQGGVA